MPARSWSAVVAYVKTHVVARRNARGGRSAQKHLVAALRSLYQRAVDDGLIAEADKPAPKVAVLAGENRRHTDRSGSALLPAHWEDALAQLRETA
jgi:hypothetical protein